jgi:hypothetical protein
MTGEAYLVSIVAKYRRWALPTKIGVWVGIASVALALLAWLFPLDTPVVATNTGSGTQVVGSVSNTGDGTQVVGSGNTVVVAPDRPDRVIESLDLEVSFGLPLDLPEMSDYKTRLDNDIAGYLAGGPQVWDARKTIGFQFGMGSGNGPGVLSARGLIIRPTDPLFPWHDAQRGIARNAIAVGAIELAFYRTPIRPTDFQVSDAGVVRTRPPPKRLEPDFGIERRTPGGEGWLLRGDVAPTSSSYWLSFGPWAPRKTSWRQDSGRIEFMEDLAASQLIIDLSRRAVREVSGEFELRAINLRINNRTVAVTPDNLTKHRTVEGDPFWEFRFPSELEEAFAAD